MSVPAATQPRGLASLATSGVQVSIGPFLVRVRSDLGGVRDYLERLYADFPIGDDEASHFDIVIARSRGVRRWVRQQALVAINGATPFLPLPAELSGAVLEWALNWCIGNHAHRWVAVHAAVVERNGRALVLSGPSGSGKSTLCAALVAAGWRLFSDEFALIAPETGRVAPLPRPISLKERAIDIIRSRDHRAVFGPQGRDIEGQQFVHMRPPFDSVRRASEQATPGWVIIPRYIAGSATQLAPLPRARALIHLTDQSFNYNYLGTAGYRCVEELVRQGDCYTLAYGGELDEVVDVLASLTR